MVMEMSKTYQYRKVMKPLLERKRRARINKCLDDLKDIMVECLTQDGEHVTRLEKADILELTVEHMRKLKQRGGLALHPIDPAVTQLNAHVVESFRSGYVHAADQITQVLLQQRQHDEVGGKVMKFLSMRLGEMEHRLEDHLPSAMGNGAGLGSIAVRAAVIQPYSTDQPIDVTTVTSAKCSSPDFSDATSEDADADADMDVVWRPW